MRVTLDQSAISLIESAASLVPSKPILSSLEDVRIVLADKKLSFLSTNQEVYFRGFIKAKAGTSEVSVNAKKISSLLGSFTDAETIDLEIGESVTILSGSSRYNFKQKEKSDFPSIEFKPKGSFKIESDVLRKIIKQVISFPSPSFSRPALNGINLNLSSGILKVCGTDGLILSALKIPIKTKVEFNIILPLKAATLILKTFTANEELSFGFNDKLIEVSNEGISIITRLIVEEYPKYEAFIPKKEILDKYFIVGAEELKNSLNRLHAVLDKDDQTQSVRANFSGKGLTLSTEEGEESFASEYKFEELETGFNLGYLAKCIGNFSGKIKISFYDKTKGFIFEQADSTDSFCLCQPLRING